MPKGGELFAVVYELHVNLDHAMVSMISLINDNIIVTKSCNVPPHFFSFFIDAKFVI